ncbi:hypothetical protein ACQP25_30335 [Microtetraspora malaysiensis]|uniref:hypothetical protein n=1 Tax=Microtetraspora malaysiensis TaxID=161358 RepID=UPI003D906D96
MDVSPDLNHIALVWGGQAHTGTGGIPDQGDLVGSKLGILDISDGKMREISTENTIRGAYWSVDGSRIVIETEKNWTVIAADSGRILNTLTRPSETENQGGKLVTRSCRLAGYAPSGLIGWCETSGRVIRKDADGKEITIMRFQDAQVGSQVSVAVTAAPW